MNDPGSPGRELAREILEWELAASGTPANPAAGIEATFQRLSGLMAPLVGPVGFVALVARAVHLSQASFPWLDTTQFEDSTVVMAEVGARIEELGAEAVTACATTLLSNAVGLLCNFIGEELTFRLLRRVWADLPEGDRSSGPEKA